MWLPDGEESLVICITVSTEYRRVTDGQTSCDSIVCGALRYAEYRAVMVFAIAVAMSERPERRAYR